MTPSPNNNMYLEGSNMSDRHFYLHNRRRFLRGIGLGAALFTVPGAFAGELEIGRAHV